jgi:hypothetical protein
MMNIEAYACMSIFLSSSCKRIGLEHITPIAFDPQSNGMKECVHCQLKDAL